MAIYEITLTQSYFGQICINRWNYVSSGTVGSALGSVGSLIATGFLENDGLYAPMKIFGRLRAIQNNQVQFVQISSRNLYDTVDFFETPYIQGESGAGLGEGLSPAMAFGFTTSRVRSDIRRGQKRFVGVGELTVGAGGVIAAGSATDILSQLATAMSQPQEWEDSGNILTFSPAICGKEKYLPTGNPEGKFAYRYYATEVEQLAHTALGATWSFKPQARTQTSRQYGRGN